MTIKTDIREPLQHRLIELGACIEAIKWAKGKMLSEATWNDASGEWRTWLSERLKCANSFAAVQAANVVFSGSGYGYGDGRSLEIAAT